MKLRPTIFLSGVSSEFASFRDAVEVELQKKGCFAENQSSFGVDYHTVEEMLRRRISEADAVIHIVGFRFGAEPKDHKPRRSYTQMEYDIAHELEKPVYVFLSSDATVADTSGTDDTEAIALQLAHRQTVQDTNSLFYFFKDKAELCKLAGEIDAVTHADFRVDISRIDKYAPADLIGREDELALLNDAWLKVRRAESSRPHILTFVALGGEGKTSLVAKWLADLAFQNWPGCNCAFAWSFYSQGTREQYAASSDLFLKEALMFFGDAADREFATSNASAYGKGQRLARIVAQRRALLILDGLEPLQYSPTSPTPGELKDADIVALLKGLAAHSDGLCIVTTRYSLPNLKAFWQTTAPEIPLNCLSQAAGIHLLKTLGVKGSAKEFETLVEDVKGHALTLNLLGTYLRDAHGGDIRRRDLIKLEEADAEEQRGHAFRVIEAYEHAFANEGDKGIWALAILRIVGLFDRPITADCFAALLVPPKIPDLTELILGLSEAQRNVAFRRLEDARLLTVNRDASGALASLDSHPLLRDYFAKQLHTQQPDAWRAAHRRLYEHLHTTTPAKSNPTLEDLQPLYQAVAHGCQGELQQQTCADVFRDRIQQGDRYYASRRLGAHGSDLAAICCFFEIPWTQLSPNLTNPAAQAWLMNEAATRLRAVGRLTEALDPIRNAVKMSVEQENWAEAANSTTNLSEIQLTLGYITEAISDAGQAVIYAETGDDDAMMRVRSRVSLARALSEAGRYSEAAMRFEQAEQWQKECDPSYPLLYSLAGFLHCDLLLHEVNRVAWQRVLNDAESVLGNEDSNHSMVLGRVSEHAAQTLQWLAGDRGPMPEALEHLTWYRLEVCKALLSETAVLADADNSQVGVEIDDVVNRLHRAGTAHHLPHGLLTRACWRFLMGIRTGTESVQSDLDEAWEIAERGPMRLFMADIHLYRARLFFREKEYPWESAEADLKAARKLIEQCGYWRRKEELEDAEQVILKNPR